MRTPATWLLTLLLAACPAFCGGSDLPAGPGGDRATACTTGDDCCPPPVPAEDGDDCVCRGAVQALDARPADLEPAGLAFEWLATPPAGPARALHTHLTFDGTPAGLAGWGDAQDVRARLQVYHC